MNITNAIFKTSHKRITVMGTTTLKSALTTTALLKK